MADPTSVRDPMGAFSPGLVHARQESKAAAFAEAVKALRESVLALEEAEKAQAQTRRDALNAEYRTREARRSYASVRAKFEALLPPTTQPDEDEHG